MPADVPHLLFELCTKLGHCLPLVEQASLIADPPSDPEAFTDAVLRAEGLDPDLIGRSARRPVLDLVTRHFNAP